MAAADSGCYQQLAPLSEVDPALADLIEQEKSRQWQSLECIASENFTSRGTESIRGNDTQVAAHLFSGTLSCPPLSIFPHLLLL